MRNTLRLLAVVKPGRYLEPGNPTGLTGLFTHPSPRSTLLYLYNATLDKLKAFPEHSVYRQSTEALTRHRLKIIESIKPEGYDEWEKNAAEKFEKNPEAFQPGGNFPSTTAGGQAFVRLAGFDENDNEWALSKGTQSKREKDAEAAFATLQELDEKDNEGASSEGLQSKQANDAKAVLSNKDSGEDHPNNVKFEAEPALDASQYVKASRIIGMHPNLASN